VRHRSRASEKSVFGLLPAIAAIALCNLTALFVGCQAPAPDLSKIRGGTGGALAPTSVQQYAQQRGISNEQARQELQQRVSQHDEEQAVENIDAVGVKQP
jgi:hypothetical protein